MASNPNPILNPAPISQAMYSGGSMTRAWVIYFETRDKTSGAVIQQQQITEAQVLGLLQDLAAKVPNSRRIDTISPLTGGGDLTADRVFTVDMATATSLGVSMPDNVTIGIDGLGRLFVIQPNPGTTTHQEVLTDHTGSPILLSTGEQIIVTGVPN